MMVPGLPIGHAPARSGGQLRAAVPGAAHWERAETCGVCQSARWTPLFSVADKPYVRCSECGTGRLYERPAADELARIYAAYYDGVPAILPPARLAAELTNPGFAHRRRRLETAVPPERRRILEIGCGDGNFLAHLRGYGWRVAGVEHVQRTADLARARHGLTVHVGDFRVMARDLGPQDVIGLYEVLEHLYEPRAWIRAIASALAPGGVLHVQVPNLNCAGRYVARQYWGLLSFPLHAYFFTPAGLAQLVRSEGLEPIGIQTYDPWVSPETTLVTFRNLASRLASGTRPGRAFAAADAAPAAGGPPPAKLRTRLFDRLMRPAARATAWLPSRVGWGNRVDLLARA